MISQINKANFPQWREISVKSKLPQELSKLQEIAHNIRWSWDPDSKSLFQSIDPKTWKISAHNPVYLLQNITVERAEELVADPVFMGEMNKVYSDFRAYVDTPSNKNVPSVAYFSMEYGLTNILKIYSGGLGVLAGDYLKEASDCAIDMTAVGFLYKFGYFRQSLSIEGQQIANYEPQDFSTLPLERVHNEDGTPMVLAVPYPERDVYVNIWKVNVGRISLYLMDTDTDQNSEWDRFITHQLYGGDWENRMKQEYLLGLGGIQLLEKLGIKKEVYHCNEGHAALINAERIANLVKTGLSFSQALEYVRSTSLYTVHTPVPAGHDSFDESLFGKYMYAYPQKLGISWGELLDLGREHPGSDEKFSMSVFACNTCQEVNGVSWLHGKVSQDMFSPIWKGYFPEELHVSYVTNGVHMPTWAASEWQNFFNKNFSKDFWNDQSNPEMWEPILRAPDEKIWKVRQGLKQRLVDYIKSEFSSNWIRNQGDPGKIVSILENINPNALIIGFGRRFATYKRAHLLFTDLDRLSKIVNNEKYPVLFFYTGKAHPADGGGQGLIKHIVEISKRPEFLGKIIFLENYDMHLAKRLISGVDVWLNTPTRPLEASGTSGEKAEMNGVLNFSVKDGWWYEGYKEGAGWALTDERTFMNQAHQDQLDAATIYTIFEQEIIPLYYAKNSKGYSPEWVQYIKNSFTQIAPDYTTKRMLDDYISRFYNRLAKRGHLLEANNYSLAKELANWKEQIITNWDSVVIEEVNVPANFGLGSDIGSSFDLSVILKSPNIDAKYLGVELVLTESVVDQVKIVSKHNLQVAHKEGDAFTFKAKVSLNKSGQFKYGFRLYPTRPELPHRQDIALVRWF